MVDIAVHTGMTPDLPVSRTIGALALDRGWRAAARRCQDRRRQERRPALLAATLLTAEECVLSNVPDLADIRTMVALLRGARRRGRVRQPQAPRSVVRAANITDHRRPARARRHHARLVPRRRSAAGRCGEMYRLGTRRLPARRASGRRRRPRLPPDGRRHRIRPSSRSRPRRSVCAAPPSTWTTRATPAPRICSWRPPWPAGARRSSTPPASRRSSFWATCSTGWARSISGLGSPTIIVDGVDRLHGVSDTVLPDRLEAGTFAIGAVITGGEVTLHDVREPDMLPLTAKLREAGAEIWIDHDRMLVRRPAVAGGRDPDAAFPGLPDRPAGGVRGA